ncbi:MAG: transposase [Planctomycetes bacterium]|nr:transposase [Planctomycetota bacterium]
MIRIKSSPDRLRRYDAGRRAVKEKSAWARVGAALSETLSELPALRVMRRLRAWTAGSEFCRPPAAGTIEILEPLVKQIRARRPNVTIILRGDSGFARDQTRAWCEDNSIYYVLGLAKNARLTAAIQEEPAQAKAGFEQTGQATRVFKDFRYRTKDGWTRRRRVVGKAEQTVTAHNAQTHRQMAFPRAMRKAVRNAGQSRFSITKSSCFWKKEGWTLGHCC